MKYILVALTLLNTIGLFAQVSIKEGVFENGLSYPVLSDKYDSTKYEIINKDILSGLKDLESNVYCISDYGYVQKGNHIQLQVMCTCMEMDKGELRFFFYNLETGMPVKYSDLFDLKSKDKAMKYLDNKVSSFISVNSNECINEKTNKKKCNKLNENEPHFKEAYYLPHVDSCVTNTYNIKNVNNLHFYTFLRKNLH